MKITHIDTYRVRVPLQPNSWFSPEYAAIDWLWEKEPITIIRVRTDAGIDGLGEMGYGAPVDHAASAIPKLLGLDPMALNLQAIEPLLGFHASPAPGYAAFEMALYDIVGQALGLPVCKLLGRGSPQKEKVQVSFCTGRQTPEDIGRLASKVVDLGYTVLKTKATADDPVAARLQAVHDAVGDQLQVTIDANERFDNPVTLRRIARTLEAFGPLVHCFESPFDQLNLDWYAMMRRELRQPLALHLGGARHIVEAIKREACDYMNLGGYSMNAFIDLAAIAEAAGIPTWHGSGVGLGISEASYIHTVAACKGAALPSDILGENLRVDDLIVEPLTIRDGYAAVPQAPGLGVTLDEQALRRFAVD